MEIGLVFFFDQETVLWLLLSSVATKQSGSHGFGTIGFWSRHMYSLKQEKGGENTRCLCTLFDEHGRVEKR